MPIDVQSIEVVWVIHKLIEALVVKALECVNLILIVQSVALRGIVVYSLTIHNG